MMALTFRLFLTNFHSIHIFIIYVTYIFYHLFLSCGLSSYYLYYSGPFFTVFLVSVTQFPQRFATLSFVFDWSYIHILTLFIFSLSFQWVDKLPL
jgi:hypothetical protein